MRILVTGADGQLGGDAADAARRDGHEVVSAGRRACDITSETMVANVLDDVAPDVLVNCAAWTRVDDAETDTDAAFRVNALGPRILASACAARGVLIVHVSTDYVFDGLATEPIDEWQVPAPRSVYGASKLAGETEVRRLAPRHQIVRTSWLYGREGPNFVLTMLRAAAEGRTLRVVDDQWGSPTWTRHLADSLVRLAVRAVPGTYHLSNAGATTWCGFARAILGRARPGTHVEAITSEQYPTRAPRPRYSVLDNKAWRLLGGDPLPAWEEGLAGYLAELEPGLPQV